jgi:hypothetical protein
MVRHQTITNQFYLVTFCAPAQQVEVDLPVSVAVEDKTPCIPPLRYVMRDPESDHTSETCHLHLQRIINVRDLDRKTTFAPRLARAPCPHHAALR